MPGLPSRPDLDQLRRQARELLRAADAGEPAAITRIRVVSPQLTLSAAQLALAREYGFRSWPALRAAVEIRRLAALAEPGPMPAFGGRWSFGGAGAIETLTGPAACRGPSRGSGRGRGPGIRYTLAVRPPGPLAERAGSDRAGLAGPGLRR